MSDAKWEKVREIFDEALLLDPGERALFVEGKCDGDGDLVKEVESLLASHDSAESFLESPAVPKTADADSVNHPVLSSGQQLGHYEIVRRIGSGGMGDVYLAMDQNLGRPVAIKLLTEKFKRQDDNLERFKREAKTVSGLNHPNILVIHEIGEMDGSHFIVSEYVEGKTLRDMLRDGSLQLGQILDISIQVANALKAAHEAHVVHRDVKPENVMIRPDGYVKVLDFGLAKLVGPKPTGLEASTAKLNETSKGLILGTVNYMSPEQAKAERVDQRTDIFSLGVVMFEMVAGRTPFAGDSMSETFANLINREPPLLSRFDPNISDEFQRIVSKMLQKDPDDRYQTMKGLLADLKSLKETVTIEERQLRSPAPDTENAEVVLANATGEIGGAQHTAMTHGFRSLFAKRRWRFYAAAMVALLAISAFAIYWRQQQTAFGPEIKSLAVLPLENLSGDPAQEYIADGMTEALITELSKIGSLRVISRTSVMQYKAARKPLPEIARELNVDAVVEGSVIRSGDRVRITAQLIRAATDEHLWAEGYERDLRNVLSLQSELARAIAGRIKVTLSPKEQGLLANARPVSPEALDAYLKGRDYSNRGRDLFPQQQGRDMLKTGIGYFEQAIRIDPSYALAYAGLARANHWLAGSSGSQELYQRAKEAATQALVLDETLAEAHSSLANVLMRLDWDWVGAEREFKRAVELDPSNSDAHGGYALYLQFLGRFDQAIREIDLAQELDPLTLTHKYNAGATYSFARQHDRAIEQYRRRLDTQPNNPQTHAGLGIAHVYKGMYEEGIAELRKASDLSGNASMRALLAWGYAASGNRSEAIKILDESIKQLSNGGPAHPYSKLWISAAYTALGNRDQAFTWLEKAYQERSHSLLTLKTNPAFDNLRPDPRYHDLLRRIGFPQ